MADKKCPRLQKYYISDAKQNLADWEKVICEDCPLDECIFARPGRLIGSDRERLKDSVIGCPKCQLDAVSRERIRRGEIRSGLDRDEDGYKCFLCGYQILKDKPLPRKRSKQ